MQAPGACEICEFNKVELSPELARFAGHVIIEGDHTAGNPRRIADLRRVAGVGLDYFEATSELRQATEACTRAHQDGTCKNLVNGK